MFFGGICSGAAWMDVDGGTTGSSGFGGWLPILIILVGYHIILAALAFRAEHDTGLSFSIPMTIFTHILCLILVLFLGAVLSQIPFGRLIRYAIPGLATFEVEWLFKANKHKKKTKPVPVSKEKAEAVANAVAATATVDDYEEWLKYMALPNRPTKKPGLSVQDEYKQWLVARARARVIGSKESS